MIYLIIITISIIMTGATFCACLKSGEKEHICNYGYIERTEEK